MTAQATAHTDRITLFYHRLLPVAARVTCVSNAENLPFEAASPDLELDADRVPAQSQNDAPAVEREDFPT